MVIKKVIISSAILALSTTTYAEQDLNAEIQLLKERLMQLEQKSQAQQQVQMTQISTSVQPNPASANKATSTDKAKVEFKPYGYIRADMAHHIEGSDKIFNKINTLPLDSQADNVNGRTLFTLNTSRLGADIKTTIDQQDILGKIEVDFRGGSSQDQLRIRHAYVKVNNWLIGQTTSPFVSADILPEMIDFMANVGGGVQRNPQIQYQHQFDDNIKSWIALEDGSKGIDDQTRLPAFTTKTQIKSDDGKSVLNFRTLVLQKKTSEDDALAWGVGLGGIYQLNPNNKIHADYYHVKGDNKFMLFANDGYVLNTEQQIVQNQYDSLAVAISHQWNPKWRSTLGMGVMLADDNGEYARLNPQANESLQQGWANLVYTPNRSLTYALEYVYGEREDFVGEKGTDNRVEAMLKYAF